MVDASAAERWRAGSEESEQVQSGDCRGDWDHAINRQQGATTFTIVSCALLQLRSPSRMQSKKRDKRSRAVGIAFPA
jgi:hypothetical protein